MEAAREVGRAGWLEERKTGIGGSDGAAIIGVSPYATPFSVWLEKTGQAEERAESEIFWWGNALEDLIAKRYEMETGREVWNPGRRIMRHPDFSFLVGTPDRLVRGEGRGLEIKTSVPWKRDEWGEEGTDEIPQHYLVQCLHYMAIVGCDVWDLAVLIGGNDLRIYTVERDEEFEREYIAQVGAWWGRHIVGGEPVPVDGSETARRFLSRRFSEHGEGNVSAPVEVAIAGVELGQVRVEVAELNERAAFLENVIREAIGENAGITSGTWSATWKKAKGFRKTDWEAVARDLHVAYLAARGEWDGGGSLPEPIEAFVERRTVEREGARRFIYRAKEAGK